MEPIDWFHRADEKVDFECYLYVYTNKGVLFKKKRPICYTAKLFY